MQKLPPYMDFPNGERAWLTVGATNHHDCWTAVYVCSHGNGMHNLMAEGRSPSEALLNLKEIIDLGKLWDAPTGAPESIDGMAGV